MLGKLKLRTKVNLFILLNVLLVLVILLAFIILGLINREFKEHEEKALIFSETIASMPDVIESLSYSNPSAKIQPLLEKLKREMGAQSITISKTISGQNNQTPQRSNSNLGLANNSRFIGASGLYIKGTSKIYNHRHQELGMVTVAFLVSHIWHSIFQLTYKIIGISLIPLILGFLSSIFLSGNIKKQIFNLEPNEIAFMYLEQASILESIKEGVIAVNNKGDIITCNHVAENILEESKYNVLEKKIFDVIPNLPLLEVLRKGITHHDQPMIINKTMVIVNSVPVRHGDEIIGAVSSFRDRLSLGQVRKRLDDIGKYIDLLRSQRHEFMNKLHLISGLISTENYKLAQETIVKINHEQQQVTDYFLSKIHDSAIVSILIGKMHQANELGIKLTITSETDVPMNCPHRDIIITILGNAIDNAFEAITTNITKIKDPTIKITIHRYEHQIFISVNDNGPGIDPEIKYLLFQDGTTTKGDGHGFGLALLHRMVTGVGGEISINSTDSGVNFMVILPWKEPINNATDN